MGENKGKGTKGRSYDELGGVGTSAAGIHGVSGNLSEDVQDDVGNRQSVSQDNQQSASVQNQQSGQQSGQSRQSGQNLQSDQNQQSGQKQSGRNKQSGPQGGNR